MHVVVVSCFWVPMLAMGQRALIGSGALGEWMRGSCVGAGTDSTTTVTCYERGCYLKRSLGNAMTDLVICMYEIFRNMYVMKQEGVRMVGKPVWVRKS